MSMYKKINENQHLILTCCVILMQYRNYVHQRRVSIGTFNKLVYLKMELKSDASFSGNHRFPWRRTFCRSSTCCWCSSWSSWDCSATCPAARRRATCRSRGRRRCRARRRPAATTPAPRAGCSPCRSSPWTGLFAALFSRVPLLLLLPTIVIFM